MGAKESLELAQTVKIYRGAYHYFKESNLFAEETFVVFRDDKDNSLFFSSELISRVSTGELLKIEVVYHLSKDGHTLGLDVHKSMGENFVNECYTFDQRRNILHLVFENKDSKQRVQMSTPPKFHISTPTMVSSFYFMKSKKVDQVGKNYFSVIQNYNHWVFEEDLSVQTICLQKDPGDAAKINLEGKILEGNLYRLEPYAEESVDAVPSNDVLKVFMSKHLTIPYLVEGPSGTKIQIKYLNHTDPDA